MRTGPAGPTGAGPVRRGWGFGSRAYAVVVTLLVAAGATACGSTDGSSTTAQPSTTSPFTTQAAPTPSPTGGTSVSTSGVDPALASLVAVAVGDLSARLGVDASQVSVLSARMLTWPDRSLGCPQPGVAYPQVQVDGTKIELSVGGTTYAYHSGGSRGPFLCDKSAT
ncbi:MAG: hypothetical protein ACOYBY_10510 [Dermatophilaceae bacterium]